MFANILFRCIYLTYFAIAAKHNNNNKIKLTNLTSDIDKLSEIEQYTYFDLTFLLFVEVVSQNPWQFETLFFYIYFTI